MEEIRKTVEGTCRWTQGWLEENSVRLDAVDVSCVLLSLSVLVASAGIKQEVPVPILGGRKQEPQETGKVREPEPEAAEEAGPEKRKIDTGKIRALRKAGRSVKWIADDMQCSVATVYAALRKADEGPEA